MGTSRKPVELVAGRTTLPTARKCRRDKLSTARGPRERRFRMSADTAIQFYDVQDRLGYQHASEAMDWLIEKAKDSIDEPFMCQNREHLDQVDSLDDVKSSYLPDKQCDTGTFEEPVYVQNPYSLGDHSISLSGYSFTEYSALFSHFHTEKYVKDLSYRIEDSCYQSTSSSNLKYDHAVRLTDVPDSTQRCQHEEQFRSLRRNYFP